ncbi:MAG: tyrosine-type recombinase/integrase [Verrucomicrobia bacterium]|jgi:site-specific recombinase XerD|nr:tyrosine-type recombinase/integrase [Verrucomicrobiota bacterium]MBT7702474.1 tyrosine-type recombinase/integrase [Verrucomicrobiota bacterium]
MSEPLIILRKDFEAYIDDWIDLSVNVTNHQASGLKSREYDLRLCVEFLRENKVDEITPSRLMDYLKYARQQRDNAPGTCNRKRASLRAYIRHLRLRGVSGAMAFPVEAIPPFCVPYQGQQFNMEPAEVRRLLDALDVDSLHGKRDRVVMTLLYKSALRVSELAALDVNDIDFERGCISVHGKGRKERDMPLDADMTEMLREWLVVRDEYAGATRGPALFLSQKGNRLAVRTIQDNFKKLVDSLPEFSIKRVTPHALRHAFASHSLELDASDRQLVLLKSYLGHSLFKSTLIYARPSMKVLRQAMTEHVASEILADIRWLHKAPPRTCQQRRKVA